MSQHWLFACTCVCAVKGLLWGSYEGQREIGYSYHIHQTQGQLVYRNSLSLVAPCHPCFIRVSLQRHEHLNPFYFRILPYYFSLFVPGLNTVNSVCLCLWRYVLLYQHVVLNWTTSFNHWLLTCDFRIVLFILKQFECCQYEWVTEVNLYP